MRSILLLCLASVLGSCSVAPQPVLRSPSGQRAIDSLLGGKAAGPPVSCLPSYSANDMSVIDGRNVAFRVGTGTVYMMQLGDGCELLGSGAYALQTRSFGTGLCSGDVAQVADVRNRQTVGSCTIGPIVPYIRPGR